ncbi:MAG TPA: type I phosphomannose isomerase catalytic subunit [Candidatus Paceibacterota bacterium]|nr:type I phosphomannose isomerase catalytic subunit [Candidatus Paceibacterota bacterium]
MPALYPFKFQPIFKERVWGGRTLETLYHKPLPGSGPIGESWEISDRPGDASIIANGSLAGKDLRWLMENHERELLGDAKSQDGLFPLLIKILDAQEKLSLQVHPPASKAAELGGDPKTEMWHITKAAPGAELYVGLKNGVTREEFERRIADGSVAECFHRVPVKAGDTMFLPSGRVHAIGAGLVIFEIQQNSDTTYRVFDWNRVGTDGKPRELHVPQSLASIDFQDFEPELVGSSFTAAGRFKIRPLAKHPLFSVDAFRALSKETITFKQPRLKIVAALENSINVSGADVSVELQPGEFCLIPACVENASIHADIGSRFLLIGPGESSH